MPYGPNHRIPSSTPEFEVDLAALAHNPGHHVMATVRQVMDGDVPKIIARFRNLGKGVKAAVSHTCMCLVLACRGRVSRASDVIKALHLCDGHAGADLEVEATGDVVRHCTACHAMWDVREFRASEGGETIGTVCARCRTKRRNDNKKKRARPEGQEELPEHMPVPSAEVDAGRDADGMYVMERRLAAQRLDGEGATPAGSTMTNPFMVHAMFSADRRANRQRCVRLGCPNPRRGRDTATLCFTCATVRSAPVPV